MKKVTIDLPKALARGVINVFRLDDDKNSVMALCHSKGTFIIPFINKSAYIDIEDDSVQDTVAQIVEAIQTHKIFSDANITKATIRFKTAPEHSHVVKSFVTTKGIRKFAGIEKILEDNGYNVTCEVSSTSAIHRDYSALLAKDPEAKAIFDENRAELKLVGATYETLNADTQEAYKSLVTGEHIGIIFTGPTGTGKSWAGRIIADKMNAPFLTLQLDRGTLVDTLIGSFVPKAGAKVDTTVLDKIVEKLRDPKIKTEDALEQAQALIKASGDSGKWEFIPGPLLKACDEGWILVLEEVNFADAGVLAKLNEFTDRTLRITVNGVSYKPSKNFLVLMTMNPGYKGTDELNSALKGRFSVVNVPALTKEQFCERMIGYSKGKGHALCKEFFSKLYDFANKIEKLSEESTYHEDVHFSVRNAQRLVANILAEGKTLDQFAANINLQYLNCLTLDNDNSAQVEKLKQDTTILNDISALYELYDYADVETTDKLSDLSDFFTVSEVAEEETEDLTDSDLDELMGGI